jgi:hypothetical protein
MSILPTRYRRPVGDAPHDLIRKGTRQPMTRKETMGQDWVVVRGGIVSRDDSCV